MEKVAILIQEIDSLLTNPREGALKSFYYFLQNQNISSSELGTWALAKPCQIVPLATIVVENNDVTAFRSLARLPDFVNAVLEVKPSWLRALLDKSDKSVIDNSSPEISTDSAALVSACTLKPEGLAGSVLQLIQEASASVVECPTEAGLRHLSQLFNALPSNILDFFTEDALTQLSSRCKEVCSRSIKTENDIEIMLAQDILAQIAHAFQTPQTPSKSSVETPPGAKFTEACRKRVFKLFSESNTATTLKLTVLRLSMFCSEERGCSPQIALEGIKLAQRIIAPMLVPTRRQWAEKNSALVDKFISRLDREGLDVNIRLEGVVFCILLLGAENATLPSLKKVAGAVLVALCDARSSYHSAIATANDKDVTDILCCFCASPNKSLPGKLAVVTRMLSFIVDQCQPWCTNTVNTVLRLHQANVILKSLHSASHMSGVLLCVVDFIQLGYVPEWWDSEAAFSLSSQDRDTGNCIREEVCPKSLDRQRFELAASFSSLLLTAAWHSSRSLQHPEICQRLLNRLRGSSLKKSYFLCSYSANETMGLEYDGALIEAQAECEELRAHLENEIALQMTLKEQAAQKEKLLEEERQASSVLERDLKLAEGECLETAQALQQAKEDYRELLQEADRKMRAAESKFSEEELLYRAELLRREKDLADELDEVRSRLEHRDEELRREKERRAAVEGEMSAAMAQTQGQVEELRQAVAEKDKALEEAEALRESVMALLRGRPD